MPEKPASFLKAAASLTIVNNYQDDLTNRQLGCSALRRKTAPLSFCMKRFVLFRASRRKWPTTSPDLVDFSRSQPLAIKELSHCQTAVCSGKLCWRT